MKHTSRFLFVFSSICSLSLSLAVELDTLPGCNTYNGMDSCSGNNVVVNSDQDIKAWQTPPKGADGYLESYQSYRDIVGYPHVEYESSHSSATITVRAKSRTDSPLKYSFDGGKSFSESASMHFDSSARDAINLVVKDDLENLLFLEPVDLLWNNAQIPDKPQFKNGQKGAIVDLFGWKWTDIELECEMIAKAGYMGVKVNPPNEHLHTDQWLGNNNILNPWYYIYQPVSYRLHARGGSRSELRSMIQKCRSLGVRVYADAVVNHMTGGGNDIQKHRVQQGGNCAEWGPKNSTAGSPFFTFSYTYALNQYSGQRPGLEYPAVPYFPSDFHCERVLNSYTDPLILDAGWLVGLADLNTAKDSVQERIAEYMTDLLNIGFSGFRWDAAKHIKPQSIGQIMGKVRRNLGNNIPADFITWLEVIIGGEKDLLACQDGPYNFYKNLDSELQANGLSSTDISKVKIWSADYPKEMPVCGYWEIPASRFVIQNDDHDQQNEGSSSRDMQDKGSVLIKDKDLNRHRGFEVQLFSRTDADWVIKVVLSSYSYGPNGENGFLDGISDCSNYKGDQKGCKSSPKVEAHDPNSCGYSCFSSNGGGWKPFSFTRVHRDRYIIEAMRKWIGLPYSSNVGIPDNC